MRLPLLSGYATLQCSFYVQRSRLVTGIVRIPTMWMVDSGAMWIKSERSDAGITIRGMRTCSSKLGVPGDAQSVRGRDLAKYSE